MGLFQKEIPHLISSCFYYVLKIDEWSWSIITAELTPQTTSDHIT